MASDQRTAASREGDRNPVDRSSVEDVENAREDVIDRTGNAPDPQAVAQEARTVVEPIEPESLDRAVPVADDLSTVVGRDVFPSEEGVGDPADVSDGPRGGPDHGAVPDDLFAGPVTDREAALGQEFDPAILDDQGGLGADVVRSDQTDHNTGLLDSLAPDDPADAMSGEQEPPADQDLSGNETGDGFLEWITGPSIWGRTDDDGAEPAEPTDPTNVNPFPELKYKDGEGFVPKADEDVDTDGFNALVEDTFGWNPFGSGEDSGDTTTLGDQRLEAEATGAIESTEDYDPETGGPVYKSPTMDPEIGDTYFGIGQAAAGGSEVQYADTPQSGGGDHIDYDGIDYGQEYTAPDLDRHEAEAAAALDPLSSPDVDPIEHASGGDLFTAVDTAGSIESGSDDAGGEPPDDSVEDLSF